jgi:hypothetical protein
VLARRGAVFSGDYLICLLRLDNFRGDLLICVLRNLGLHDWVVHL